LEEKYGGEVVVVCAGPTRAGQTIREALAKGADRAIHLEQDNLPAFDTLSIAHTLAAALASEKPDLILTGCNRTTWARDRRALSSPNSWVTALRLAAKHRAGHARGAS
jgi:electron transfer flavoprotein alpha/beta subunit